MKGLKPTFQVIQRTDIAAIESCRHQIPPPPMVLDGTTRIAVNSTYFYQVNPKAQRHTDSFETLEGCNPKPKPKSSTAANVISYALVECFLWRHDESCCKTSPDNTHSRMIPIQEHETYNAHKHLPRQITGTQAKLKNKYWSKYPFYIFVHNPKTQISNNQYHTMIQANPNP